MNSIRNFFAPTGPSQGPQLPGFLGNALNWIRQFRQFAANPIGAIMSMKNVNVPQGFQGNPEQLARYLMNSGQMSQDQFQQLAQTANQLQNMFPKV